MKVLYRILLAVFIIIFVVSGSMLGYNLYQSYKEKSGLEELAAEVEDTETSGTGINGNPDVAPEVDEAARLQKYQLLHEKNKDMVGWIKIPNTAVNYPVMQTMEENEFYLRRNFQKEYAMSGLPFLDVQSNLGKPSSNFVIYGHNMDNKTMFYDILKYEEEDYWKKHPIVRFDTLKELGEYEVMAAFYTQIYGVEEEVFKYYSFFDTDVPEEYDDFVSNVKALCPYDTGITAKFGDQLLTLSTCSYHVENGRFVVVARKKAKE